MDEQELVPCRARRHRIRPFELSLEDTGQRRLGEADGADHQMRGNLSARTVGSVAVGQAHIEQVIGELRRDRRVGRRSQPPSQAVLASLQTFGVDATVLPQKEAGGSRECEEPLVERGREGLGMPEHDRRGAADGADIPVGQLDELHHLPDESRHVGRRQIIGRRFVHAGSIVRSDHLVQPSCDVSPWCRGAALTTGIGAPRHRDVLVSARHSVRVVWHCPCTATVNSTKGAAIRGFVRLSAIATFAVAGLTALRSPASGGDLRIGIQIGAPFPRPAIIVPPQPVVVAPPPQPVVVVPQPPPVVVAPEPALVIEPGDPVYFLATYYSRLCNAAWVVAGAYDGPWLCVPQPPVPPRVLALPNAYGRRHHSDVQVVGPHPWHAHEDHYHGHSHWRDGRD